MFRTIVLPLILFAVIGVMGAQYLSGTATLDTLRRDGPATTMNTARSSNRALSEVYLAPDANGHFRTDADINGRSVAVMVDTGASSVALPRSEAALAGIRPAHGDFTVAVNTANGTVYAAPVTIDEIEIGTIRLRNVSGLVLDDEQLSTTLLGMSFLSRLSSFTIANGELKLVQ